MPIWLLVLAGMITLVWDALRSKDARGDLASIGIGGTLVALFSLVFFIGSPGVGDEAYGAFGGVLQVDYMGFLGQVLVLAGTLWLLIISPKYIKNRAIAQAEYYALLTFSAAGLCALAISRELVTLFLNLELASISIYVMAAMEKKKLASSEAGFKYFMLGSFAAAFILMGIAFLYGGTGTTSLQEIQSAALAGSASLHPGLLTIGVVMLIIGFSFKLTLAPFHMYAPDVYDGAPTTITALIATTAKVPTFIAFFVILKPLAESGVLSPNVALAFGFIALLSMILGNTGAISQPRIKRLVAYSSIGHSGYMAIPFVVMLHNPELIARCGEALSYYLMAYLVMTLLLLTIAMALGERGENEIDNYKGLYRRQPVLSALVLLAVISLIGIPGTVGFLGKFMLFSLAAEAGLLVLAVLGILTSVASAFYYLRLLVTMYFTEEEADAQVQTVSVAGCLVLTVGAVAVVLFGLFPWLYLFQS